MITRSHQRVHDQRADRTTLAVDSPQLTVVLTRATTDASTTSGTIEYGCYEGTTFIDHAIVPL